MAEGGHQADSASVLAAGLLKEAPEGVLMASSREQSAAVTEYSAGSEGTDATEATDVTDTTESIEGTGATTARDAPDTSLGSDGGGCPEAEWPYEVSVKREEEEDEEVEVNVDERGNAAGCMPDDGKPTQSVGAKAKTEYVAGAESETVEQAQVKGEAVDEEKAKSELVEEKVERESVEEKVRSELVEEKAKSELVEEQAKKANADEKSHTSEKKTAKSGTGKTENDEKQDTPAAETPLRKAKARQIREAAVHGHREQLQVLAESAGGFLADELRQIAWPFLLGVPVDDNGRVDPAAAAAAAGIAADEEADAWQHLPPHRDEEQVQLDVKRAFVYYPRDPSPADDRRMRRELSDLIVEVLRRQPYLCYFQGFHDICQVLLLVLPPPLRTAAVLRLAVLRIRDFLLPTIDAAVHQLSLLPDILRAADPALWTHLRRAQHPQPFFALSGTLTLYAHDLRSLAAVARVFDVLLARPPAFSVYLFAAIIVAHRDALFATPADEPEMLHHILSQLPAADDVAARLDALVADAARLAATYPPPSLAAWRAISAASVLKTAVPAARLQSVADGRRLFHVHVRELARDARRRRQRQRLQRLLKRYRRPLRVAATASVAVLVAALAVWLRRSATTSGTARTSLFTALPWPSHNLLSSSLARPMAFVATALSRLGMR